jgi:phosphoglycolate phosphatase-like HAD superfamily hydrolase
MTDRLVLFDIDETMISSDGAGRKAIHRVLNQLYGVHEDTTRGVIMSGKTDPQILREILEAHKMPEAEIPAAIDKLLDIYLDILEEEILNAGYYIVHDGVFELVEALGHYSNVYLGLLTGNVERGARMKLEQFGLNKYFPIGAYGSDSHNRLDLPAVGRGRGEEYYKVKFTATDLVIIGDAVNDVRCAKHFGAKCIAVNTGRTTRAELEAQKPEYLFPSLSDTQAIIDAILAPMPA